MWNILFYTVAAISLFSLAVLNTQPGASVLIVLCAMHLGACGGRKLPR